MNEQTKNAGTEEESWYSRLWDAADHAIDDAARFIVRQVGGSRGERDVYEQPENTKDPNAPDDLLGQILAHDFSQATVTTTSLVNASGALSKFTTEMLERLTGSKDLPTISNVDYLSLRGNPNYFENVYKRLTRYGIDAEVVDKFKSLYEGKTSRRSNEFPPELHRLVFEKILPVIQRSNKLPDTVRTSTIAALSTMLETPNIDSTGKVEATYPSTAAQFDAALRVKYQNMITLSMITNEQYRRRMFDYAFGTNFNPNDVVSVLSGFQNTNVKDPLILRAIGNYFYDAKIFTDVSQDTYTSATLIQQYLKTLAENRAERALKIFETPQASGETVDPNKAASVRLGAGQPQRVNEPARHDQYSVVINQREFRELASQTLDPAQVATANNIYYKLSRASSNQENQAVSVKLLLWSINNSEVNGKRAENDPAYARLRTALSARLE